MYFGDAHAQVYALDAATGALKWKVKVEEHLDAMITGGVVFHDNRLYVPVSSLEEGTATLSSYECCTFRGSVVSLDAATGKQLWKTYTIPRTPEPAGKNSVGTQLRAPSGAAVWSAPALDPERNRLYITTGDSYSSPGSAGERRDHGARDGYRSRAVDTPDARRAMRGTRRASARRRRKRSTVPRRVVPTTISAARLRS